MKNFDQWGEQNNYYQILGVKKEDSDLTIKKAYHKQAIQYHPDKNPENKDQAEIIFKKIQEAYETLKDPNKRMFYDLRMPADGRDATFTREPDVMSQSNSFYNFFRRPAWQQQEEKYRPKSSGKTHSVGASIQHLQTLASKLISKHRPYQSASAVDAFARLFYEIAWAKNISDPEQKFLDVLIGALMFGQKLIKATYFMRSPMNSFTYVKIQKHLSSLGHEADNPKEQIVYLSALKQFIVSQREPWLQQAWQGKESLIKKIDDILKKLHHKSEAIPEPFKPQF